MIKLSIFLFLIYFIWKYTFNKHNRLIKNNLPKNMKTVFSTYYNSITIANSINLISTLHNIFGLFITNYNPLNIKYIDYSNNKLHSIDYNDDYKFYIEYHKKYKSCLDSY